MIETQDGQFQIYEGELVFNRESLAIILSDIHLGDIYAEVDVFKSFLIKLIKEIELKNLPYLKTLIILGDFFDIMRTSFLDLCVNQDYVEIYELIQKINRKNISIILVLGNHEISTTGFYNRVFKSRKKDFLSKMKENGFEFDFLNNLTTCQYAFLKVNAQNILTISLYDSLEKISFNQKGDLLRSDNDLKFSNAPAFNNQCYFMTHGFQFDDWSIHHFIKAPWWSIFLKLPDDIKKGLNQFWFKLKYDRDNFDDESFFSYLKSKGIRITNSKSKNIKELIQNDGYEDNKRYCKNFIETLYEKKLDLVTHVIFGHTHEVICAKRDEVSLLNPGCWFQNQKRCFIEILNDGSYSMSYIKRESIE